MKSTIPSQSSTSHQIRPTFCGWGSDREVTCARLVFAPRPGFLLFAGLLLLQLLSASMLLAQSPATPSPTASATPAPKASAYANAKLIYEIIDSPKNTFGYDVYAEGRLMIHQTSVPALPGDEGFKTKADAEKVARLVIEKIRKGEMPPTVTIDEMKRLNVLR